MGGRNAIYRTRTNGFASPYLGGYLRFGKRIHGNCGWMGAKRKEKWGKSETILGPPLPAEKS